MGKHYLITIALAERTTQDDEGTIGPVQHQWLVNEATMVTVRQIIESRHAANQSPAPSND
jgi:hypothetical protein